MAIKEINDLTETTTLADTSVLAVQIPSGSDFVTRKVKWSILKSLLTFPWGSISGTLADQTDLQSALNAKAASSHTHTESDLSLSDVTTKNASTSMHGFTPKLPNDSAKYLDGTGAWSTPAGGGGGGDYLSTLVNSEVSITGATTANWGRQHVVTGSTDYTITLQACSGNTGKFMSFRILNTGVTTLDGNSSETIDGVTTMACYQGQNITLYCDGTNAHVINLKAGNLQQWFTPLQFASNFTKKYTVRTSQPYNFAMEQSSGAADGDWISVMFFANKGTYTVSILGFTAGSCAKQDWSLNGVNQTTGQDWYSSSTVYNVVKTFTMTVPYTGVHTLKSTINGRNASASGWDFEITAIAF